MRLVAAFFLPLVTAFSLPHGVPSVTCRSTICPTNLVMVDTEIETLQLQIRILELKAELARQQAEATAVSVPTPTPETIAPVSAPLEAFTPEPAAAVANSAPPVVDYLTKDYFAGMSDASGDLAKDLATGLGVFIVVPLMGYFVVTKFGDFINERYDAIGGEAGGGDSRDYASNDDGPSPYPWRK